MKIYENLMDSVSSLDRRQVSPSAALHTTFLIGAALVLLSVRAMLQPRLLVATVVRAEQGIVALCVSAALGARVLLPGPARGVARGVLATEDGHAALLAIKMPRCP